MLMIASRIMSGSMIPPHDQQVERARVSRHAAGHVAHGLFGVRLSYHEAAATSAAADEGVVLQDVKRFPNGVSRDAEFAREHSLGGQAFIGGVLLRSNPGRQVFDDDTDGGADGLVGDESKGA